LGWVLNEKDFCTMKNTSAALVLNEKACGRLLSQFSKDFPSSPALAQSLQKAP
jgi:hypothetical protein